MPPVRIFISYAHEDEAYCKELRKTLADLVRDELIAVWTDHQLLPGDIWNDEIRRELKAADLILFLVSRSSIASEYIDRVEFKDALERHRKNETQIVPIIVSRCDWEERLGSFQALPPANTPIAKYRDKEDAWYDVRMGLKAIIKQLQGNSHPPLTAKTSATQAARQIAEGVTKRVDRARQESAFYDFYDAMRAARPGRPQIYVLVEDDLDRPEFLIERLYELRVAPLTAHGACRRAEVKNFVYGSLRSLQRSVVQNLFLAFEAGGPPTLEPHSLLTDARLSPYSHVVVEKTLDGEKLGGDADKFVGWFINECWAEAVGSTQWLIFLVLRFSSLDPGYADLRERLLRKLRKLFGRDGRVNVDATDAGAPGLLLPTPDAFTLSHLGEVLAHFPFASMTERNEVARLIYAELSGKHGVPRIDNVYERLEQLRTQYLQTGRFEK